MIKIFTMEVEDRDLLVQGGKTFGIDLAEKTIEAFELYLKELLKWNQKINLTAIRSERGIVLKHFIDSFSVYPYLDQHSSVLDIGSGAGFPGIPLKIVQPALEMTLIDSVRKKVDFQRQLIRVLGLKGVEAIHGRVQDTRVLESLGGRFDIILSRAFSDLRTFLVLGSPFLKEKGLAIAMKGAADHKEMELLTTEAEKAQYRLEKSVSLTLPFSSFKRTILLFQKQQV
ncbi:MAG: 16S rRNA (guanine(527)-N(7))-methyltransferase RsmG [Thermodesulfobacteriota bacterium]